MERYVFDTNTLVSAVLFPKSKPGKALRWVMRNGALLISPETLDELVEVMARDKFERYVTKEERGLFLNAFIDRVERIEPIESVIDCRDPKDNKFLEVAIAGKAQAIISGDTDLLELTPFRGIPIINANIFLELIS